MEANRRNDGRNNSRGNVRREYPYGIDGTAARKLANHAEPVNNDAKPEREYRQSAAERNVRTIPQAGRETSRKLAPQSAAPAIDLKGMLVLSVAIIMTFYTCISYLQVQAEINSTKKAIVKLENMTEELSAKNDYTELQIEKSVDLSQIQQVAMKELGMIYPYNNQMITYQNTKNGYVRQYGELLGNEEESFIELLFRMFR